MLRDSRGRFVSGGGGGGSAFSLAGGIETNFQKVQQAADTATFQNLRHAAFSLRKKAAASIVKSSEPSPVGSPVATRGQRGANVKASIFTDVQPDSAIIGPRHSYVGDVMEAHEFGKKRKGDSFEERPTMQPALLASVGRFHSDWSGTIGE